MMKSLFLFFFFVIQNSFAVLPYTFIFKNKSIFKDFSSRLSVDLKQPIILNSDKHSQKKDFCKIVCAENNIRFKEYTFDDFITESPHNNLKNTFIYVNDFLIKNGRILNHYEENKLKYLHSTTNLVALNTENISNIPFKDLNIIHLFPIIQYTPFQKKDIVNYMYNIISFNKYNDKLYLINWKNYDIDSLDFKQIDNLLLDISNKLNKGYDLLYIQCDINNMIKLL